MGLKYKDLKDTVTNLISIDEYEAKTGTPGEIIVIAFHVIDEFPAQDLSDFIEKSFVPVIDVEKSPNPNNDGQYLVFVELKRSPRFYVELEVLLKEVERLTGSIDWKISPYLDDNIYNVSEPQWKSFVIVNPKEYISKEEFLNSKTINPPEPKTEDAKLFFQDSNAVNVMQEGKQIRIQDLLCTVDLNVIAWEKESKLLEDKDFKNIPFDLLDSRIEIKNLRSILGPNWNVFSHNNKVVINRKNSEKVLYAEFA